jgi:hypothetical protein
MGALEGTGTKFPNGINIDSGELFIGDVAMTSTAVELNKLDGVTATTAEINAAASGLASGKVTVGSRFFVNYPQVAAADVAKTFFIAPAACKVISAYERHVTVSSGACVLNVEKLASGAAPGGTVVTLTTGWDLTSVANTPVSIATLGTAAAILAAGDALCLKVASGGATGYALGTITMLMEWV